MVKFMGITSVNSKLGQDQVAKELGWSSSLQLYRQKVIMFSPYRIPPDNHKRKQKISNRENDFERQQMTSNDLN